MSEQAYQYEAPLEPPPSYHTATPTSRGNNAGAPPEQQSWYHASISREHAQRSMVDEKHNASNPAYSNTQERSRAGATDMNDSVSEDSFKVSDEEVVAQKLSWLPPPPEMPISNMPLLAKPVAIPQIDTPRMGRPMPFTRAYSYALQSHGVQLEHFVAFLDALAIAQAAPAPLQALNIVGNGVGFVPHHLAQAVGAGISLAAGAGTAAVIITRTKMFMERVNKEYFGPRALKASLVSDEELAAVVRYPANAPHLLPLDLNSDAATIRERRLKALDPYLSPLTFDVPPPAPPSNVLDKLSAKQIQATIAKNQKKAAKEHRKAIESPSSSSSWSDSSDSDEHKLRELDFEIQKIELKAQQKSLGKGPKKVGEIDEDRRKDIAKVEKKREKLLRKSGKKQQRMNRYGDGRLDPGNNTPRPKQSKKQRENDEKASKKARKLKWIVITDLRS